MHYLEILYIYTTEKGEKAATILLDLLERSYQVDSIREFAIFLGRQITGKLKTGKSKLYNKEKRK